MQKKCAELYAECGYAWTTSGWREKKGRTNMYMLIVFTHSKG